VENSEEIKIKDKVSDIRVNCRHIIISNLGIVPKETERKNGLPLPVVWLHN
jgi:hypothetical protein